MNNYRYSFSRYSCTEDIVSYLLPERGDAHVDTLLRPGIVYI